MSFINKLTRVSDLVLDSLSTMGKIFGLCNKFMRVSKILEKTYFLLEGLSNQSKSKIYIYSYNLFIISLEYEQM